MVYEAYIGSFLRTILILGLAYYSIRFIIKLFTNKSRPNINPNPNPGKNKGKNKGNDDLGEYVDYEEVED